MQKKPKKPMKRLGVECLFCGWIGISRSRHDFRMCHCENQAFVDGGVDYLRSGAAKLDMIRYVTVAEAREETDMPTTPPTYFYGVADAESGTIYKTKAALFEVEGREWVDEILKLKVVKRIKTKKAKAA